MTSRKLIAAILACLMLVSVLLTACSKTPEDTDPEATTKPVVSEDCSHAQTEIRNAVAATCTAEGYSGDTVCIACGEIVSKGASLAIIDHVYDEGRITKAATCMETGVFTYFCKSCGVSKVDAIQIVAHDDEFHDALDGGHTITCSHCTKSEYATHTPTGNGIQFLASCLEPAYTLYTCADCKCDYKVYDSTSLAIGHTWGNWVDTLEADCSHTGVKERECSACFDVEDVDTPVDASKHNYKLISHQDASCTKEGSNVYKCEDCAAPKTETLAKTEHSLIDAPTPLSATASPYAAKVCENCEYTLSSLKVADKETTLDTSGLANDNFEVELETAKIVFPESVVSQFKDSDQSLSIKADTVSEAVKSDLIEKSTTMSDEQKERLNSGDIYEFGVTQGEYVDAFKDAVTVTLPYVLGEDEDPEGVVIWYVKNDGSIESFKATYNAENSTVTFSVSHFSFYAIAYEETQEMRCRKGNHDFSKDLYTLDATCHSFGYTSVECLCCHHISIVNIIEKKDHNLSNIINPSVTCDNGGYKYKACLNTGCGYRVNYEYVRATGHKPTSPATCTEPAMCSVCNKVAIAAKGHSYTAWETVVQATATVNGIQRRFCTGCGAHEERTIASTGTVADLDFKSYMELINYVFCDSMGLGKGQFEFTAKYNDIERTVTIKVDADDKNTIFSISVPTVYTDENGTTETSIFELIYKNGTIFLFDTTNGKIEHVVLSDIESQFGKIDALGDTLSSIFEESIAKYKQLVEIMDDIIIDGIGSFSTQINDSLKSVGIDYTYDELESLYSSVKKIYAYTAYRLGQDVSDMYPDGVELPHTSDVRNVMKAFMKVDGDSNGNKIYSYDLTELLEAASAVLSWAEKNIQRPISTIIYDLLKEDILSRFPELTDWDKTVNMIKTELNGEISVSDAIDKIMDTITNGDAKTLQSIYDMINMVVGSSMGAGDFDIEKVLLEYSEYSLDEFAQDYIGAENMDQVYDVFSERFKENSIADIYEIAPTQFEVYQTVLSDISEDIEIQFVIDARGKLVSMKIGGQIEIGEKSGIDEYFDGCEFNVAFIRDNNVSITIPKVVTDTEADAPKTSFDANGNLVITIPDSSYDVEIGLRGTVQTEIAKEAVKDADMTAKYGFDVYRVFKTSYGSSNSIYSYNGKFYKATSNWKSEYTIKSKVSLQSVLEATTPAQNTLKYSGRYNEYDVYSSPLGYVYEADGVWYLIDKDNSDYGWYGNGLIAFDSVCSVKYADIINSIQLSNISNTWSDTIKDNGVKYRRVTLNLSVVCEGWKNGTLRCDNVIIDDEGALWIADIYSYSQSKMVLSQEISVKDFPAHIYYTIGYKNTSFGLFSSYGSDSVAYGDIVMADGTPVTGVVERVYFATASPVYYAKLTDSLYVNVNDLSRTSIAGRESLKLSDGKTLYIIGGDYSTDDNGKPSFGVVYGYVSVGSNYYAKAACQVENGKVTEVTYYEATAYISKDLRREFNIDSYVTKTATGYTVSKELFDELNTFAYGGARRITLVATKDDGNTSYHIQTAVVNDYKSVAKNQGMSGLEWSSWFDDEPHSSYTVQDNPDGSVTIYFRTGGKISIDYGVNNYIEVTEALSTKDTAMSQSTGLNIYSNTHYSYYNRSFIKADGKLYQYNLYSCIIPETFASAESFIRENWKINNFSYRYDFVDDEGNAIPVYDTSIYYTSYHYGLSFQVYTIFKDGKLQVLTGVEQINDGRIKFESMTSLSEYIKSLKIECDWNYYSGNYTTVYVDGVSVELRKVKITLSEGEERVATFSPLYYTKGSQTLLVGNYSSNGNYVVLGEVADVGNGVLSNTSELNYYNGSFTIVNYKYQTSETLYFVKLAGKLYFYNGYSESYVNQKFDHRSFQEYFCRKTYDKNGNPIYNNPEGMLTLTFDDGTVFYYTESNTNGFLKAQDGYYVRATLITDGDEKYVVCNKMRSTVSASEVNLGVLFKNDIKLSGNDSFITINASIVDTLSESFGEYGMNNFYLKLECDGYSARFSGETIKGWFQN